MKKIVIIIMVLLITGCSNENTSLNENNSVSNSPIKEDNTTPSVESYEDNNPVL